MPNAPPPPRLLDRVRAAIRARGLSARTGEAYAAWIRRFIVFHGRQHPSGLGSAEIEAFLSHLANEGRVAASTQNQALAALLFLYARVLCVSLPNVGEFTRAKRPNRLPDGGFAGAGLGSERAWLWRALGRPAEGATTLLGGTVEWTFGLSDCSRRSRSR